jgi:hypothetical protein
MFVSPSELNAPTVASKRSASCFFFKAKIGVIVSFSAANRALKAARVTCALFAALEAKHHHHPHNVAFGLISIIPDLALLGYPFSLLKKALAIMARRTGNEIWTISTGVASHFMAYLQTN